MPNNNNREISHHAEDLSDVCMHDIYCVSHASAIRRLTMMNHTKVRAMCVTKKQY
jgi:hypothetical protein